MNRPKSKGMLLMCLFGIIAGFKSKESALSGTTFHAVTNGNGGFIWQLTVPSHKTCQSTTLQCYCTIITDGTGYVPSNNMAPDLSKCTAQNPVTCLYK
jgi:hypothetical protein